MHRSVISDCLDSHATHIIRTFVPMPRYMFFRPVDVIAGHVDETSLLVYLALLKRKVGAVNCILINASKMCFFGNGSCLIGTYFLLT